MKSLRVRRNAKKVAKQRRNLGLTKFQKKMPDWKRFHLGNMIRNMYRYSHGTQTPESKAALRKQLQQCISFLDKM